MGETVKEFKEFYDSAMVKEWAERNWGSELAPNGQLIYENFLNWFGNSKAITSNDIPRQFYHRTNSKFNVFDKKKIGSSTDHGYLGKGFYFNSYDSEVYGTKSMAVYLRVIKPCSNIDHILTKYYGDRNITDEEEANISNLLQNEGYDGVLGAEAVVYEPWQIKSIKNQGNFDINNPSIYQ